MATAESAAAGDGPRYAPDDPSLPKPWIGLIDGSSGAFYYWNPETNVTQYEKPAALPPPLPAGPQPGTPNLAPIPGARMIQPNGGPAQYEQQMARGSGRGEVPYLSQTDAQQQPHGAQQGSQVGSAMQHSGQVTPQHVRTQTMGQPNQQTFPFSDQQRPPQQGNQIAQAPHQMSQQMGHQTAMYPGGNSVELQNYQYPNQQMQYNAYQPNILHQDQQRLPQQTQQAQVQQFSYQQEPKSGFSHRGDADFPQGRQSGFPAPHAKQGGMPIAQSPTSGTKSDSKLHMGVQPGQVTQFGGPSFNMQQPPPLAHQTQSGTDLAYQQHVPRFQNQMGPAQMHGQHSNVPTAGLKRGYEESPPGRGENDYFTSANKAVHGMPPQQPKLAAIPLARNHMDTRMAPPLQNALHAHAAAPNPGPASQDIYNHAHGVPPYPRNPMSGPPSMVMGSPDANNISATDIYRQKHEITATGDNVPAPFMSFEATCFPQEILREIYAAGFTSPTPIQAQTWPIALQNKDIVAVAKTGSGKTLGYLMPAFMLLRHRHNNPLNGPTVLVLAPTRELATQIQDEVIKFGRASRVSCTCLYGGAPKGLQLKELDRGADIVVATPGRLNDILEMKKIDFRQISLLVLDEADRMLDMGFEPQIRKIVNEIPARRQTLMYTATWPKEVRKIAGDLLVNPVQVNIGKVDELAANKSITQVSTCSKCGGDGNIITDHCKNCGGRGKIQTNRIIKVVIPPGVIDGVTMQLRGEGNVDNKRGIVGDLLLVLHVNEKKGIRRDGLHLYSNVDVDYTQAILGTVVKVETVDGLRDLQIPSGIQFGDTVKLPHMGVPDINKPSKRGDHHFVVKVQIPKHISYEERILVEKLASYKASRPECSSSFTENLRSHSDQYEASSSKSNKGSSFWKSIKNFWRQKQSGERFASVSVDTSVFSSRLPSSPFSFTLSTVFILTCIFTLLGKVSCYTVLLQKLNSKQQKKIDM